MVVSPEDMGVHSEVPGVRYGVVVEFRKGAVIVKESFRLKVEDDVTVGAETGEVIVDELVGPDEFKPERTPRQEYPASGWECGIESVPCTTSLPGFGKMTSSPSIDAHWSG